MQIISKLTDKVKGYVSFYYLDDEKNPVKIQTEKVKNITEQGLELISNSLKKIEKSLTSKLNNIDLSEFNHNTSVQDARRVAARLLGGNSQFQATRVEWGWGSNTAQRNDTDIQGPFNPRVFTPFTTIEYPQPNIIRFVTILGSQTLTFPTGGPVSPYPFVREVGLKTNAVNDTFASQNFPNGILIARHVNDADIPKTSSNVSIGLTWIYIYN